MAKVAQPPVRPRAKNSRCPNSRDEFHAFVADNNLHEGLAEEWYAMHEAREWVDRDGKLQKDIELHHWNYNKPNSIILLNARIHKRMHKLITINRKTKTFIVNETGEKLNTMKKHCDFIEKNFPLYTISRISKL